MAVLGGKLTLAPAIMAYMPTRFSRAWFLSGWKMIRSFDAERKGDFRRAISLSDEAADIAPLQAVFRVRRANLLLRLERSDDAYRAFDALRREFERSRNPDRQYLRHYCTAKLSLMQAGSSQWSHEAEQANAVNCSRRVKVLFPMISSDDIQAPSER
jgi:hypothetical protein